MANEEHETRIEFMSPESVSSLIYAQNIAVN